MTTITTMSNNDRTTAPKAADSTLPERNVMDILDTRDPELLADAIMVRFATEKRFAFHYHFMVIAGGGIIWTTAIATAATDGYRTWANPVFIAAVSGSLDEAVGVLCHESAHQILEHMERIAATGVHMREANIPADWVVNAWLAYDKIALPACALRHDKIDHESTLAEALDLYLQEKPEEPDIQITISMPGSADGEGDSDSSQQVGSSEANPGEAHDENAQPQQGGGADSDGSTGEDDDTTGGAGSDNDGGKDDDKTDETGAGTGDDDGTEDDTTGGNDGDSDGGEDDGAGDQAQQDGAGDDESGTGADSGADNSASGDGQQGASDVPTGQSLGQGGFDEHYAPGEADAGRVADIEQRVREAYEAAASRGCQPAGQQRLLSRLIEPRIDPAEILHTYFSNTFNTGEPDWGSADRQYLAVAGIFVPDVRNETSGVLGIVADTSGSVGDTSLAEALGFVQGIIDADASPTKIAVAWTDSKAEVQEFDSETADLESEAVMTGGGGTKMEPGLDALAEWSDDEGVQMDLVIIITDGHVRWADQVPAGIDCPVIVIRYENVGHACDYADENLIMAHGG